MGRILNLTQPYLIEILQKRYKGLFVHSISHAWPCMSPSGNGLRNTSQRKYLAKEKSNEFIIDETQIKVGWFSIYLALGCNLAAIEPKHRQINTSD